MKFKVFSLVFLGALCMISKAAIAQTGAEAPIGLVNERARDTVYLKPELSKIQYRQSRDHDWKKGVVAAMDTHHLVVDGDTVPWRNGTQVKGYVNRKGKYLETGTGKNYLYVLAGLTVFCLLWLGIGLLASAPIYILFPKILGVFMVVGGLILLAAGISVTERFRIITHGKKWKAKVLLPEKWKG